MNIARRLMFWWRYLTGQAPWDTNETPPEIVDLIEGERLSPGKALDLGCGTGTNVIYLARHGWHATGIDFVRRAIRQARRKARLAGVTDRVQFLVGDVTRLSELELGGPFDLALDIGCGHGLPAEERPHYAENLAPLVTPGSTFMLYMFRPTEERPRGLEPGAVGALFAPHFRLLCTDLGDDRAAGAGSAWYRFERTTNT